MPDTYDYDVFISYSSVDRAWVRNDLLPVLEGAGLTVCIDYRDFPRGAFTVSAIEQALQRSRKTLLILTPAYLQSEWTAFEGYLLQTRDPTNQQLRLIPLLHTPCELPPRLLAMTYVNFADPADRALAWRQLLTALGRPPLPESPPPPERQDWLLAHPYAMPPHFTGRADEQAQLSAWLNGDAAHPLLLLRALGGFGKSALAWHWLLQAVDPARWPRVVWWSFYESEATFANFLRVTLAYLGIDPDSRPGPRQQIEALLDCLRRPGLLLILDGFERELRAYSGMGAAYQGDAPAASAAETAADERARRACIAPLADDFLRAVATLPGLRGKLLLTSRLRPGALEVYGGMLLQGGREIALAEMQPADALAFFGALGIRGNRAEIAAAGARYGYHPLSLRLLAGLVLTDLHQPGDIAAAARLDVSGDLIQRRNHVLEQSYAGLPPARQQVLSRIACFRSPVAYDALVALADPDQAEHDSPDQAPSPLHPITPAQVARDLRSLLERGLLQRDERTNRFDLHPIVRRYAYDRLGDATRRAAHGQLRDYFAAVEVPERIQNLEELIPLIELYHHTVRAGQYNAAQMLFRDRINQATYYQFGAYQVQIELLQALFPDGEPVTPAGQVRLPRLADERDQAWTLNELANSFGLSGQPRHAIPLFEQVIHIYERSGDKGYLAIGLGNLAYQQMAVGALRAAGASLRRCIALGREIGDAFVEAAGHQELGRLLAYRGAWAAVETELAASTDYSEQTNDVQGLCIDEAYRALLALLRVREAALPAAPTDPTDHAATALTAARRALELADERKKIGRPNARDYVRAHWLLGAAHRVNGAPGSDREQHFADAEQHLTEALTRCRSINAVDTEVTILLELARLRAATGKRTAALGLAQEALTITERCGYVLPGADGHLLLAGLLDHEGREREHESREMGTLDHEGRESERETREMGALDHEGRERERETREMGALDHEGREREHESREMGTLDHEGRERERESRERERERRERREQALEHARAARRLATCDGPPDYTYRVAYDEAGYLLTRLGEPPADG